MSKCLVNEWVSLWDHCTVWGLCLHHSCNFFSCLRKPTFLQSKVLISSQILTNSIKAAELRRRKWQPTPVFLPGESQGRGTRWAEVYGVAQSRTQLKRLSSSSSSQISLLPNHSDKTVSYNLENSEVFQSSLSPQYLSPGWVFPGNFQPAPPPTPRPHPQFPLERLTSIFQRAPSRQYLSTGRGQISAIQHQIKLRIINQYGRSKNQDRITQVSLDFLRRQMGTRTSATTKTPVQFRWRWDVHCGSLYGHCKTFN